MLRKLAEQGHSIALAHYDFGMGIIFITHDLGVIAETCNEVVVMYAGRMAEQGRGMDAQTEPSDGFTSSKLPLPGTHRPPMNMPFTV